MDFQTQSQQLVQQLAEQLLNRNWQLATAESCTGGWVSTCCTDLAGSSAWFERGFVTYTNIAKSELLGVPSLLLEVHGAVSQPVVEAMAIGALQRSQAQLSVALSGIAGPGGGSADKPVGTVWLAWACQPAEKVSNAGTLGVDSAVHQLPGDRQQVRQQAVLLALQGCLERLSK